MSEARVELAGRGFDYLSGARMNFMLNNAKNAFEDAWAFPWLRDTATGPAPLTIPDLKLVRSVRNGTDELIGLDLRQIVQDGSDLNQPGIPAYWWLEGPNIVHVWPVGAATLNVFYVVESPELSDDDDQPLIPVRYQPIWIDLAVVAAYVDSDNFTGAQALQAQINARLLSVIERYETVNRQHAIINDYRSPSEDD